MIQLYGGSGSNRISGGSGDDNIYVNYNSVNGEIVDGGEGIDTLTIDFTSNSNSTDVRNSAMYNIENIIFKNVNSNYIYINTEQLSSLDNVENDYVGTYPWDALRLNIYGDNGDDIDFSNFKNNNYRTVSLLGDFDVVDYSNNITAYPDSWYQDEYNKNQVKLNIQSLNDFIGSSGDDRIEIQDSRFDADLSSGDDTLILNASSLSGNIDGGEGSDTLTINYGFTDLTNATILNFENIDNGSNTILLTSEQFADLSLDGSGKVYIKENGVITGTIAADDFSGTILDTFEGAGGDDIVSNIHTFVVSGNQADYTFIRNSSTLTLEQTLGTKIDGTDTLNNVLNIQFADNPELYVLDDAPNDAWTFVNNNDGMGGGTDPKTLRDALISIDYDKQVSLTKNYSGDSDIFVATLVPNSPYILKDLHQAAIKLILRWSTLKQDNSLDSVR